MELQVPETTNMLHLTAELRMHRTDIRGKMIFRLLLNLSVNVD